MLYLTCTTIPSVDLAHYIVSHAKDWVSVDCGTNCFSGIFSNLYLYVRQRGVKLQNKMDFREIFRSICLSLDNTAAS